MLERVFSHNCSCASSK